MSMNTVITAYGNEFSPILTKPLLEPKLTYCQLDPSETFQWNFIQNKQIFNQQMCQNVVCKILAT